jgi:uncharacterized integral membrane protein
MGKHIVTIIIVVLVGIIVELTKLKFLTMSINFLPYVIILIGCAIASVILEFIELRKKIKFLQKQLDNKVEKPKPLTDEEMYNKVV